MFERFIKAIKPYALSIIVVAGLALVDYLPVVERKALGYAAIVAAFLLIVFHFVEQLQEGKDK